MVQTIIVYGIVAAAVLWAARFFLPRRKPRPASGKTPAESCGSDCGCGD